MIAIIDYGAGNLQSVEKALRHIGCACQVTGDPRELAKARSAVLPGVGAFGEAMAGLRARGLEEPIKDFIASGRPFLGICLGLQALFQSSQESPGVHAGLKLPHIGWNSLEIIRPGKMLAGLGPEPYFYFVHSYYLQAEGDVVTAAARYGAVIHAAVERENLWACQFHPEKSGEAGLRILRNFAAQS